jgi:glycosidase
MQHGRAIHEETRMPMLWGDDQDKDLFEFYRQLIQIRKSESALVHGKRETVFATEEVLAYRRMDDKQSVLSVMNISEKAMEFELDVAESSPLLMTKPECRIQAEESLKRFFLPPFSGMIVK